MQRIFEILDTNKVVLLSLISFKERDEDEWWIILRIDSAKGDPIAKALSASGFHVTYVG